jgi:hypothetical protein
MNKLVKNKFLKFLLLISKIVKSNIPFIQKFEDENILLLLLTANGFSPGGSGTTIRQKTNNTLTTIRQQTMRRQQTIILAFILYRPET